MKKAFVVAVTAVLMTTQVAHAKRMGGGRSFGKSSSMASKQASRPAAPKAPVNLNKSPAPAQPANAAPMRAPVQSTTPMRPATPVTPTMRAPVSSAPVMNRTRPSAPPSASSRWFGGFATALGLGALFGIATSANSAEPCADPEKAKELPECPKPQ